MALIKMQIGKNGLTSDFIAGLRKVFEKNSNIRVNLLKSSTRDKKEAKKWAEEIVSSLGKNYSYKLIGYTIILRRWRKGKEARED
jgi:RNA-binding protein YhbY